MKHKDTFDNTNDLRKKHNETNLFSLKKIYCWAYIQGERQAGWQHF